MFPSQDQSSHRIRRRRWQRQACWGNARNCSRNRRWKGVHVQRRHNPSWNCTWSGEGANSKWQLLTMWAIGPIDYSRRGCRRRHCCSNGSWTVSLLLPHNAFDYISHSHRYMEALKSDPDIILGGRSYDPAPFAGFCMSKGVEPGTAWHMGKIMECGGFCAIPRGRSMIATMRTNSFDLTPISPLERCTPLSVAAQ